MTSLQTTINISEEFRVDGAAKLARANLRAIEKKKSTFKKAFTGDEPGFPMSRVDGGTEFTRELYLGTRSPTPNESAILPYMSPLREDSEEE